MGQATDYDSASRQGVGPALLRRLRSLHEGLALDFGASLSRLLRTPADVSLQGASQTTYGQFVYNIDEPACFYVLKAEPWDERLMLSIDPAILHPMIDRMLGGAVADEVPNRPLTEIELCLTGRIVRVFIDEYRSAWRNVAELKLEVLQSESSPRMLRILPADEMVILLGLELSLGDLRGMMRICLPCRAVERLANQLPIPAAASTDPPALDSPAVTVTLAETQLGADELADLRVGDIIATETAVDSPAVLSIDKGAKFHAKPGIFHGRKAVRLTEKIEE